MELIIQKEATAHYFKPTPAKPLSSSGWNGRWECTNDKTEAANEGVL